MVEAAGTSVGDALVALVETVAPVTPVDVESVVAAPEVEDAAELVEELTIVDDAPPLVDEVAGPDDELEPGTLEDAATNVVDVSCPNASDANSDDTRTKPQAVAAMHWGRRGRWIRRLCPPRPISVDIVISLVLSLGQRNKGSTALRIRRFCLPPFLPTLPRQRGTSIG